MPAPRNPARGLELPQTKLTPDDIRLIWELVAERERLKREAAQLTNAAIAQKFEVHQRTIDKVLTRKTHFHVNGRQNGIHRLFETKGNHGPCNGTDRDTIAESAIIPISA